MENCKLCGNPATGACGRCRAARYCGRECQAKDWPEHQSRCFADGRAECCGIRYEFAERGSTPGAGKWGCGRSRNLTEFRPPFSQWRWKRNLDRKYVSVYEPGEGNPLVVVRKFSFDGPPKRMYPLTNYLMMRDVEHPNLLPIGNAGFVDDGSEDEILIAMDLGTRTLHQFVDDQTELYRRGAIGGRARLAGDDVTSADDALVIAYQILRGVAHLRSIIVSHNDLHYENVLVMDERVDGVPGAWFHRALIYDYDHMWTVKYRHWEERMSDTLRCEPGAMMGENFAYIFAYLKNALAEENADFCGLCEIIRANVEQRAKAARHLSALDIMHDRVFAERPMADAKYVAACSAKGVRCTVANFVEAVLPAKRLPQPETYDSADVMPESLIRAMLSSEDEYWGPRAGRRFPETRAAGGRTSARTAVVAAARLMSDFESKFRARAAQLGVVFRHNWRVTDTTLKALELCRLREVVAAADGDPEATAFWCCAVAGTLEWSSFQWKLLPSVHAKRPESIAGLKRLLTELDFDVHHRSPSDFISAMAYLHDVKDFDALQAASALAELAMLDDEIGRSVRPSVIAERAFGICVGKALNSPVEAEEEGKLLAAARRVSRDLEGIVETFCSLSRSSPKLREVLS